MFRSLAVQLSANPAQIVTAMRSAGTSTNQFADTVESASNRTRAATQKLAQAMTAVGVAMVAAMAASAAAAIQLETRMQNVATIWDKSAMSISTAGQAVVDMSTRLPQSANTLAEALYNVASSGFQGADSLFITQEAGKAASAGLTTADTAVKGITAVLNAYGLSAGEATRVSDVLFQTVNLGVVTFDELASNLGNFVGMAAQAGVSIEDVSSAYATMTLAGLNADEAATSTNRVMQAFIKPGKEMTAVLQSMGYETGIAALQTEGFRGITEHLAQVVGRDNVAAFAQLFPQMRGLRGELALLAAGGQNYARVSEEMAKATGATQRALDEQAKSAGYQLSILKNQVVALAIGFGQALLPVIKVAVTIVSTMVEMFRQLRGPFKTIIAVGTILGGILIGIAGAFVLMAPLIAALPAAMAVVTGAMGAMATAAIGLLAAIGPIGWAIAGIGVVGGILFARHAKKAADAKRSTDDLSAAQLKNASASKVQSAASQDVIDEIEKQQKAQEELAKALNKIFDPTDAISSAATASREAEDKQTDQIKEALRQRHDLEKQALDDQQAVEKRALTERGDERKRALDQIHDDELKALDHENDLVKLALDERHQVEVDAFDEIARSRKQALDRIFRDQKEGLDRQQQAEEDALDERLALLDDEYDRRKKAEERRWEAEKDDVQAMIDSTFGAEREGWKTRLLELEDAHDERLNVLDHQQDAEVRTEKNALDERQQQQDDALDDRQEAEKNALEDELDTIKQNMDDQYDAEKRALDDRYEQRVDQAKKRQDVEKRSLESELTDLDEALGKQQRAVETQLENRQRAEDTAADIRRTSAKTKEEVRLADLQAELDKQLKAQQGAFDNMVVIAQRGAGKINEETLLEIAKLPPSIIAEIAKAGQPAFQNFIDTFGQGIAGVNILPIINAGKQAGDALATGMAQGWYNKFATTPVVGALLQGITIPGYAEGHYATIAMSGPRLWAEPETGGESYIPLAQAKRGNSLPVLAQTAAYFGYGLTRMANGGYFGPSAAAGGVNINVQVENHLAPGIDMGVAGRVIRDEVERGVRAGFDELGRRVVSKAWGG